MIFSFILNITLALLGFIQNPSSQTDLCSDVQIENQSAKSEAPSYDNKKWNHGFEINSSNIARPEILDNLCSKIDLILQSDSLRSMSVKGFASIDGPEALNRRLAHERANNVCNYIVAKSGLSSRDITVTSEGENWAGLASLVETDTDVPMRDEVLSIIHSRLQPQEKETKLRRLGNGAPWRYLAANILPATRKTVISIEWMHTAPIIEEISDALPEPEIEAPSPVEEVAEVVEPAKEPAEEPAEEIVAVEEEVAVVETEAEPFRHKLYLKTNAPAWLVLWTNIAVEADIAPHWSAQIPVYYSGFNYFKSTLKFRTLAFQPEVRVWLRPDNQGLFFNAHGGIAWYNYAKNQDYRYQDCNGNTPALGGGIGLGYRWNLSRNGRWKLEASVGAGVYRLKYDIFENRHNGPRIATESRTFYGIDNAALSFSYTFDLSRKGGSR